MAEHYQRCFGIDLPEARSARPPPASLCPMASSDSNQQFLKSTAAAMRAIGGGVEHQVTDAGTDTHVGRRMSGFRRCHRGRRHSSVPACAGQPTRRLCGWRITTNQPIASSARTSTAPVPSSNPPNARVEAIGARDLKGVGDNLEAALNQHEDRQIEAPGQADETGIAEACASSARS